jgi:transcriptional regulator with XRE-family HTH domain
VLETGDATLESRPLTVSEPVTFGSYVRSLRERAGLITPTMARSMGVGVPHYVRIEANRKAPFPPHKWAPLLELGADEEQLHALSAAYWKSRGGRTSGRRLDNDRMAVPPGHPRSVTWDKLPWEQDDWCWYAVAHHADGLAQDQVAALTGWSVHRVDQLEKSALAKLRNRRGAREALECLELLHQHRDQMLQVALAP